MYAQTTQSGSGMVMTAQATDDCEHERDPKPEQAGPAGVGQALEHRIQPARPVVDEPALEVPVGSVQAGTICFVLCAANAAQRLAVDRAAKGEVAALTITKQPKPVTPLAFPKASRSVSALARTSRSRTMRPSSLSVSR